MKRIWLLLLAAPLVVSCLELPTKGRDGEPCFENGLCAEGLACHGDLCRPADADAGKARDAGESGSDGAQVIYPDTGYPKDAGHPKDAGDDAADEDAGESKDAGGDTAGEDTGVSDAAIDGGGTDGGAPGDAGDAGDTGTSDAGAQDTGGGDAGDPCDGFICMCPSYCTTPAGVPKCVPGCRTTADCCPGTTCSAGTCQ